MYTCTMDEIKSKRKAKYVVEFLEANGFEMEINGSSADIKKQVGKYEKWYGQVHADGSVTFHDAYYSFADNRGKDIAIYSDDVASLEYVESPTLPPRIKIYLRNGETAWCSPKDPYNVAEMDEVLEYSDAVQAPVPAEDGSGHGYDGTVMISGIPNKATPTDIREIVETVFPTIHDHVYSDVLFTKRTCIDREALGLTDNELKCSISDTDVFEVREIIGKRAIVATGSGDSYKEQIANTTKESVFDCLLTIAESHPRNPFMEKVRSVEYDGTRDCSSFLSDMGLYNPAAEDERYIRAVSRAMFLSILQRQDENPAEWRKPIHFIPIITGDQGAGKSLLCRKLGLDEWSKCTTAPFDDLKKFTESVAGSVIAELNEGVQLIGDFRRSQAAREDDLKAIADNSEVWYRDSYGRESMPHRVRYTMFITSNMPELIHDVTGHRRFFTVHMDADISAKRIVSLTMDDMLQYWADAVRRYDAGERWDDKIYSKKDQLIFGYVKNVQEGEFDKSPVLQTVEEFLDTNFPNIGDKVNLAHIRSMLTGPGGEISVPEFNDAENDIKKAWSSFGFKSMGKQIKINGKNGNGYIRIKASNTFNSSKYDSDDDDGEPEKKEQPAKPPVETVPDTDGWYTDEEILKEDLETAKEYDGYDAPAKHEIAKMPTLGHVPVSKEDLVRTPKPYPMPEAPTPQQFDEPKESKLMDGELFIEVYKGKRMIFDDGRNIYAEDLGDEVKFYSDMDTGSPQTFKWSEISSVVLYSEQLVQVNIPHDVPDEEWIPTHMFIPLDERAVTVPESQKPTEDDLIKGKEALKGLVIPRRDPAPQPTPEPKAEPDPIEESIPELKLYRLVKEGKRTYTRDDFTDEQITLLESSQLIAKQVGEDVWTFLGNRAYNIVCTRIR